MVQAHILQYMRQMAIITPYAHFDFEFRSEGSEYVHVLFRLCLFSIRRHVRRVTRVRCAERAFKRIMHAAQTRCLTRRARSSTTRRLSTNCCSIGGRTLLLLFVAWVCVCVLCMCVCVCVCVLTVAIAAGSDKAKTPLFVEKEFSNISKSHAAQRIGTSVCLQTLCPFPLIVCICVRLCLCVVALGELDGLSMDTPLSQLQDRDVGRLTQLFREAKFDNPDGGVCCFLALHFYRLIFSSISFCNNLFACADGFQCLSPIGEYNLRLGILKVVKPELVATYREEYVPSALLFVGVCGICISFRGFSVWFVRAFERADVCQYSATSGSECMKDTRF